MPSNRISLTGILNSSLQSGLIVVAKIVICPTASSPVVSDRALRPAGVTGLVRPLPGLAADLRLPSNVDDDEDQDDDEDDDDDDEDEDDDDDDDDDDDEDEDDDDDDDDKSK
ncbi:unnamed protein product [Schistocephalus solidus]|uniref:Uncharacterized protein n=1 Tax=Schistocephalus solidus TaxID=70667 RepID=A0A183SS62_SCHSO|nr:unnamed protein product [Schistocephalus solidus]